MIFALLACSQPDPGDTSPEDGTVDLRIGPDDVAAPPDGGIQLFGPEVTIQPGEDKTYCLVGTYTGADSGVDYIATFQNEFGHHVALLETTSSELDFPDGSTVDCTDTNALPMTDLRPILIPGDQITNVSYQLPDGMAAAFDEGTRYVIQSHFINTGEDPILVRDVVNLGLVPEDEVTTWASALALTRLDFSLPPGEETTVEFDCSFTEDYNVLHLFGHMHEWGERFAFDHIRDGNSERLYQLDEWKPEYRDAPPIERYEQGELQFLAGDTLRTSCTWFNDQDTALEFPNEMCVTAGMIYPARTPAICSE